MFPYLLHKYHNSLSNPNEPIYYKELKNKNEINKKLIQSIHCFNLEHFEELFTIFIELGKDHFSTIVTFCNGEIGHLINKYPSITWLQIKNKGFDLGNKFVTVQYLKDKSIDYNYIFYLHSKSDLNRRKLYYRSFVQNYDLMIHYLNENPNLGGIFPDLLIRAPYLNDSLPPYGCKEPNYTVNNHYMSELNEYFSFSVNYFFIEGNFFVIHKDIASKIYSDLKIYNLLNEDYSCDINWVKTYYNYNSVVDPDIIYEQYKKKNHCGNSLELYLRENLKWGDAMIEHSLERCVLGAVINMNKDFKILPIRPLKDEYLSKLVDIVKHKEYDHPSLLMDPIFYVKHNKLLNTFKNEEEISHHYLKQGQYRGLLFNHYLL